MGFERVRAFEKAIDIKLADNADGAIKSGNTTEK